MTKKTLKEFKSFLAENCWKGEDYTKGKYDRKIYDWFVSKDKTATATATAVPIHKSRG